jgi:hypothetical protein
VSSATADQLLTVVEVAARWQLPRRDGTLNPNAVWRLTREGALDDAVVRLGRARRYRLAGIEQFEETGGIPEEEET